MSRKVLGCIAILCAGLWAAAAPGPLGQTQNASSNQSELDQCLQRCREEIQQGRADEAVAWGEKAIALAPASAEAHF